jgi:hypothetical protein
MAVQRSITPGRSGREATTISAEKHRLMIHKHRLIRREHNTKPPNFRSFRSKGKLIRPRGHDFLAYKHDSQLLKLDFLSSSTQHQPFDLHSVAQPQELRVLQCKLFDNRMLRIITLVEHVLSLVTQWVNQSSRPDRTEELCLRSSKSIKVNQPQPPASTFPTDSIAC